MRCLLSLRPFHWGFLTLDYWGLDAKHVLLFTPPNASWLNQAELLLDAFAGRYLKRGSWTTPMAMIQHILASWAEYNVRFAHPFQWNWTCQDFRYWLNNTPGLIRCKT